MPFEAAAQAGAALFNRVAGFVAQAFVAFDLNQKLIQFVVEMQQGKVRLQLQTDAGRVRAEQGIDFQGRLGFVVESLDVRPFQPRHVQGQRRVRRDPARFGLEKLHQAPPRLRKVKDCDGCRAR